MSISVTLPDDVAAGFTAKAARREMTPDAPATEIIAERLPDRQPKEGGHGAEAAPSSAPAGSPSTTSSEGLAAPTDDFWRAGPGLARFELSPLAAEHPDALLRRLGPFRPSGSDVDGIDLAELLAPVYAKLAAGAEHRGLAS